MKYLFFILLVSASLNLSAQKDNPVFGKVDKADLDMKECSFDKSAEAEVLFDYGEVYCNLSSGFLTTELSRHVRIKILTDNGLSRANIKIPYYSDRDLEDIKNIQAQTINVDASGNLVFSKVDKNLIYRKKLNKHLSEVIFTFPEVKKGSIIEYKFVDYAQNFNAVKNWYFQKSIPVRMSRYIMDFPAELITASSRKGELAMETVNKHDRRNISTYTMRDIPALRNEAYITCDEDYQQQVIPILQAVDFPGQPRRNLITTWQEIIKDLMEDEDFGTQLKKNIPRTADLDLMLAKITDPYQKMVTIHEYVKRNMHWDESTGIWAMSGVKSAWKDKKGTLGEINLILVNLLKDANLTVHPVLVSTRENGRINTGLPGYRQFDKVMAYVEIDGHQYVLDATNKYTPAKLIPYEVLSSEGLVIENLSTNQWGWKVLYNEERRFKNITLIKANLEDNGTMNGEVDVTSYDYTRLDRIPELKKGKSKFIEKYFASKNTGIVVDSLRVDNEDVDSLPLNQHAVFTGKTSASGDYRYFSVNLFSGLEKNPFLADSRFSDVFFGAMQNHSIIGNFTIPDGFVFEDLPKNTRMIMPDTSISFSRIMSAADNHLSVRIQLDVKKPFYTVEEYPYLQEFYKKLYELLNEQVVFKKK